MKQEKLDLRKNHYLFITFKNFRECLTRVFRTNRPVAIQLVGNGKEAFHVVDCGPYSSCEYWLYCECWTIVEIKNAEW